MQVYNLIIGAGPAGLAAAAFAPGGATVLEGRKNPGWKILISGGGRCNVTNTLEPDEFLRRLGTSARFLRHALHSFPPEEIRAFLSRFGCPTAEREEGHVYPKSNVAADVLGALLSASAENASQVIVGARVSGIKRHSGGFLVDVKSDKIACHRLLIAAGSPGFDRPHPEFDAIIAGLGHTVVPWVPGLAPIPLEGKPFAGLEGVSVTARIAVGGKWREPGEMLFTDEGISGPASMDAAYSVYRTVLDSVQDSVHGTVEAIVHIDFLPAWTVEKTVENLLSLRETHPRAGIEKALEPDLPRRLVERLVVLAGLKSPAAVTASQFRREDARRLAETVHSFRVTPAGIPPLSKGYTASGGVPLSEVNPRTLESKITRGLFFAGEILDYDAPTGGFNITLALAAGRLAAESLTPPPA